MSRVQAGYNEYHNSIDIRWAENVIFIVDCEKVEDGLNLTPGGQYEVNVLALNHPLEYVRMALEGSMKSWVGCGRILINYRFGEMLISPSRIDSLSVECYNLIVILGYCMLQKLNRRIFHEWLYDYKRSSGKMGNYAKTSSEPL